MKYETKLIRQIADLQELYERLDADQEPASHYSETHAGFRGTTNGANRRDTALLQQKQAMEDNVSASRAGPMA